MKDVLDFIKQYEEHFNESFPVMHFQSFSDERMIEEIERRIKENHPVSSDAPTPKNILY